jgi:hypothetical protein
MSTSSTPFEYSNPSKRNKQVFNSTPNTEMKNSVSDDLLRQAREALLNGIDLSNLSRVEVDELAQMTMKIESRMARATVKSPLVRITIIIYSLNNHL